MLLKVTIRDIGDSCQRSHTWTMSVAKNGSMTPIFLQDDKLAAMLAAPAGTVARSSTNLAVENPLISAYKKLDKAFTNPDTDDWLILETMRLEAVKGNKDTDKKLAETLPKRELPMPLPITPLLTDKSDLSASV
jgi:hypothetical protein